MRSKSSRALYFLLFLYAAASMTYYVAGVVALTQEFFFNAQHVRAPFQTGDDGETITNAHPEATQAGLADGDVLETVDGSPFTGEAQLGATVRHARPGDILQVSARARNGHTKDVRIPLHAWHGPDFSLGGYIAFLTPALLVPLLSLILGYWVVAARPRDLNAWLVLILLTFPEIAFGNLDWRFWAGIWSVLLGIWNQFGVHFPLLALLWFGIYFPERWRADVRWPWVKWLLTFITIAGFGTTLWIGDIQFFHESRMPPLVPLWLWTGRITGSIAVLSIVLFLAAILDKLRSASTPDARRRLRVLAAGSGVSLTGMVIISAVITRLNFQIPNWLLLVVVIPVFILFPFTLAYVVIVQRAMNVRILLRMGTKYLLAKATLIILQIALVAIVVFAFVVPVLKRHGTSLVYVTLAAAALGVAFRLSRIGRRVSVSSRLHAWLDRRFFREAYNAEVVLSELSETARRFTERGPLIETVSRRISEILHVPQIAVWLRASNAFHLQQAVGIAVLSPVTLPETSATVQNLVRTNRPATVYRDRPEEWLEDAGQEEKRALNAVNAELLLPLPGRERLMGVMALGPKRSEEPYTPTDLRVLQSVATQTGLALEITELAHSLADEAAQRERINREMEIAREVQQRLFPQRLPQIAGLTLAGTCRPALGVGGDYYDFIELEDGRLGIAVGDVSGKGISAALLMASLRASLRGMTLEGPRDLAKTIKQVNRLVYEASASNRYATFFFAAYDPSTCELRYVNVGHNPPIIMRGGANPAPEPLLLEAGGLVVGLLPEAQYEEQSITMNPGDVLLAYTDGISEAMTSNDEEWGEERMLRAAHAARNGSAPQILEAIFRAADEFTSGAPQHDDMTLLILKLESCRAVS